MALGGMRDHVGGGFHRYSVDEKWFVPHFEKMLYDQAQIALNALEVRQATGDERFKRKSQRLFEERRGQSSLIIVSHNLRTVRRFSDHVAVLINGKIEMFDSVDEAQRAYRIES